MRSKLKALGTATKWLLILCLPLLLLTAGIGWAVNSSWLYQYGFEKYGVSQTTGLSEIELDKAARGLISYFNSNEDHIDFTVIKDGKSLVLFNQREVLHLKDVKGLFQLNYGVLLGTLIYGAAYSGVSLLWRRRRYWRQLAWGTFLGSSLTLALMLALGVGTLLFGFDRLFLQFHLLSFATAGMAVILGGVGGWYVVYLRGRATS
jgi:uncharacterized membrane protein